MHEAHIDRQNYEWLFRIILKAKRHICYWRKDSNEQTRDLLQN